MKNLGVTLGILAILVIAATGCDDKLPVETSKPSEAAPQREATAEFKLVGLTYLNSYPGVCGTPELVKRFNQEWKAVSDASYAKLVSQVSDTYSPHLPLDRCPTCASLVRQGNCIVTHPGDSTLDSDRMPGLSVVVMEAHEGMAQVKIQHGDKPVWTATANLELNEQVAVDQAISEPMSDFDEDIRDLPRAAGWTLEGGKVCADNIALSHKTDCTSPDVNTKCALVIDAAANFVISDEEQGKFAMMSGTPGMFSKSERVDFLKQLRREACPNYSRGTRVSLVLLDQSDQAVVLVPGKGHPWYTSADNPVFGTGE